MRKRNDPFTIFTPRQLQSRQLLVTEVRKYHMENGHKGRWLSCPDPYCKGAKDELRGHLQVKAFANVKRFIGECTKV